MRNTVRLGNIRLDCAALARALEAPRPLAADLPSHLHLPETANCWVGRAPPASIRLLPSCPLPDAADAPLLWIDTSHISAAQRRDYRLQSPLISTPLHPTEALERLRSLIDLQIDLVRPGTLVRIHGYGVLIQGESGVGKSETALMLLERGHPLVSDDAVRIVAETDGTLRGSPPGAFQGCLAVHGLGLVNVKDCFGENAVASSAVIRLIVTLTDTAPMTDPLHGAWSAPGWLGRKLPHLALYTRRPQALLVETAVRQMQARHVLASPTLGVYEEQAPEPV